MKASVPVLIGVWMLWVGICSVSHWSFCCNGIGASKALHISDDNAKVVQAEEGIKFGLASKDAIVSPLATPELEKLVTYMEKYPAKVLILNGGFTKEEAAKTDEQYLGLERAESFREHLVEMGIPVRQIAIMEQVKEELAVEEEFVWGALEYSFKNRFLKIEDGDWSVTANDNLVFSFSDFTTQVSPVVQEKLEKTANYLQSHSDKVLVLTGMYSSKEDNSSVFNDLGLARANTVKNVLLDLDVPQQQLRVQGAKSTELDMFDSAVIGGVGFKITELKEEEDRKAIEELETELKAANTEIYFETGKDEIQLKPELRAYFTNLAYYFSLKSDAKVMVVGHTDNQGSSRDNKALGEERAKVVRDQLVKNGISTDRIEVSSRGDKDPIKSNKTKEGRAMNRRVEVAIK